MKKSLFLFIPLILMLVATAGSAEKAEKAPPSKTTADVQIKPAKVQQSQVQPVPAAPKAGEEINWQVISQGGTDGGSASYRVAGTVAQTALGSGSSASYQLLQGFWQEFGEGFVRGDCTGDGVINGSDVVCLLNYLYRGYPPPDPYEAGDANCDGVINGGDVVRLLNYLFRGWPPPSC